MTKDVSGNSGEPLAGSSPSNSSNRPASSDGKKAVPDLLLKLIEACAEHKRRHDHDRESNDKTSAENEGGHSGWCHEELQSLARVLPRLEASIAVRDTHCDEYHCDGNRIGERGSGAKGGLAMEEMNDEDAVGNLCALYRAIARGVFCPNAARYLFVGGSSSNERSRGALDTAGGDIAKGILPRIAKLLQLLALDPVRVALSPLKQPPNKHSTTLDEAVQMHHQEEDIGSTIAALLNLLEDEQLRFAVVCDLMNLSNDLSTIDESKALFEPPIEDEEDEGGQTKYADKVRVHVFTDVARILQRRTSGNVESEPLDFVIRIPSRRSLLALHVGVWTTVQHFVPIVLRGDELSRSPTSPFSVHGQGNKMELINSLLSSSRSASLVSRRPSSHEPYFLGWSYSPADVMIHSLLILRTKLAIIALFTDIDMEASASVPSIDLALLTIEAVKSHLIWGQHVSSEASESSQEVAKTTSPSSRELEHNLSSMSSWALSNLVALAVLFPDKASMPKNDIWSHAFPHLIDCIPHMTGPPKNNCVENESLRRVVLCVIHVALSSNVRLVSNRSTPHLSYTMNTSNMNGCVYLSSPSNAVSFFDQFRNRCIVRGYFSHLFELVKDFSESISGTAISIVTLLLESFPDDHRPAEDKMSRDNLVETACSNALGALETIDPGSSGLSERDSPVVRLGSKRRKLEPCQDDREPTSLSSSLQSTFAHAIYDACHNAQNITARLTEGNQHHTISGGPEVVSLFSEADTRLLRGVAGALRVLLSLRRHLDGIGLSYISAGKVISSLFQCVKCVAEILVRPKSENDKLIHVEPNLFYSALSSIVSVGLHACRSQRGTLVENLAAREALSYCAISSLAMIDIGRVIGLDEIESSTMIAKANTSRLCRGTCCRLTSMIGAIERPCSHLCLCRLVDESTGRLSGECGAFTFDDVLPLQCRCIFLAMMFPVASDSEHYEPTLSSIQCILGDTAHSQSPVIVQTTLLGLPNLFISLASRRDGHGAAAAKYLTIMMDSFSIEDLVIRYAESDTQGIQISVMLTLARLARVYTAASLVASSDHYGGDQLCTATSYLWQQLSPTINGMHTVILSMFSLHGCFSFTSSEDAHFQATLGLPLFSKIPSSLFCRTKIDSPRQLMANLVYLQSVIALAPESMIRSSNINEFLSDKRHYGMFDELAEETTSDIEGNESVFVKIPPPVWLFLMPFLAYDTSTQASAANVFGQILFCNGCKVFSACFIPESEMRASLNQVSKEASKKAADKLFTEIDFCLLRFCGLGRDLLSSKELDILPGHGTELSRISDAGVAIGVFRSLCQWSPLDTTVGDYILERSLLALIRIWVASSGGYAFNPEDSTVDSASHSSLASNAFGGLNEIFKYSRHQGSSSQPNELLKRVDSIMPKILMEFFLPPLQHTISAKTRYHLLSLFIGSFLLPSSAAQSLQAQHTFDVASVFQFIDSVYPSVIVQMIKDEDHEAIQMCVAFRMYLLRESRKIENEEMRVQKKSIDEFIIGTRQENQRSGSNSRSLVPGLTISTTKLVENAKLFCIKKDVISHVLPQLLLHPGRAPLRFFTTNVCQSQLDYPDILGEIGMLVLKTLVWELGRDDPEEDTDEEMYDASAQGNSGKRKNVRLALTKGYLLKEGSESSKVKHLIMSPSQDSINGELCINSMTPKKLPWIAENFMYLMVNVIIDPWAKRSEREKFQVVKCLRAMIHFLPSADVPQYMPQILTAINTALSTTVIPSEVNVAISKLRFIAVATLFDFTKIVASHDASQVGENLTTIVVALFPLFSDGELSDRNNDLARRHAVQMLEWLAGGEVNENLPLYFSEIPFLPPADTLKKVRSLLTEKGVQLDDIRLMSQQQAGSKEGSVDDAQLEAKFYNRMNILSQLAMSHENKNVRMVVVTHMTDLIKANRDILQNFVANEELSSMHFLTVVHDPSSKKDSSDTLSASPDDEAGIHGGFITKLLIRLLSRCVDESDSGIRDAIASCLGEIGAIDPNRLGKEIISSQLVANSTGSDDNGEWRLSNPPWKNHVTVYQLRVVTNHLVSGLKSSTKAMDQHKISFAIQELLKVLDLQLGGSRNSQTPSMTLILKEKLQEADASIVETFWSTEYKQVDILAPKPPPFFSKSNSYYSWLSSFCRFLIARSNANKHTSVWRDFFHACRSAIRCKPGVAVAEFFLPFLVLDAMCFGERSDEDVIIDEFLHVLSFDCDGSRKAAVSPMNLKEREKAANAVFTVMDVLRQWMEEEMELKHQPSAGGKSKRSNPSNLEESSWPAAVSTRKIERLLKRIPLASCATAASKVGMRARALQFLEMEGRRQAAMNGENNSLNDGVSKFLESHFLDGVDTQLTQILLGQLNDFDTMVFVAQKNHQTDLRKRLTEEAAEREMYEDWEGACQAYEQLLDSRLNHEIQHLPSSAIENTETSAQEGLLRCLLKLGRLDSVLNQAYGMSKQSGAHENTNQICAELLPSAAEAAWRLGNWRVLDNLLNNLNDVSTFDANARYQLSFGQTMHSLHSKSRAKVISCLKDSRESIMSSLSSAARDGYTRSYPYLMQLHSLREVEYISSIIFDDPQKFQQSFISAMTSDQWRDRLELSTPDITNTIINTRLALSRMANEPTIEGLMWLDIGKVARKGGLYQVAEQALTQANVSFCKSLNENGSMVNSLSSSARESIGNVKLQVAKLKHAIGESMTALKLIEDDIPASVFLMDKKQLKSYVSSDSTAESGEALARRILQATEWMGDGLKSSSEIKDRYQTVLKLAPNWERAHFNYAKYLDALFESRVSSSGDNRAIAIGSIEECQEYLLASVQHYGMALQLGQKHVYQALPRMLAMWLEFTSFEEDEVRTDNQNARLRANQELMNKVIKSFASKIPEHLFYTALPQLLSRVVHNNAKTSKNVALILRTVLAKYPRQSMWACGWLRFSKSEEKKKAGDEIFYGAQQKLLQQAERGKQMQSVLIASKSLFLFFTSLAQFVPKANSSSVRMKVPVFDTELKNFIPPIQAALSLSPGALEHSATADVFPSFVPRMRAFNPELKIMQSKAKPKKVSIFAVPSSTAAQCDTLPTDGKSIAEDAGEMHFLVKQEAKGDLRKDSRVQDLNNVINRIFASRKGASGPNGRRRRLRLQLRTFSVVCLTEDCGILEWVPNTESLRSVITETYNPQVAPNSLHRRGSRITNFGDSELRNAFIKCQDVYFKKGNLDLASKKFDELVLKQYLPVMYWWFIQNFQSPHSWFEARTNFTLSTAVWSAVGHIIGLGDRHSENILIDTSSGECVHVDFDCIFDKGLLLPRPEVIPFRLTPNMLDAFGPTGADGLYTGALTESMRTLRKNRDTLLSVLEPFLNDPVINFKGKSRQKSKEEVDKDAEDKRTAKTSIEKIEGRLDGEYNLVNPNPGKLKKNKSAPSPVDSAHFTKLSVEGQVQKMIMEATSHENLVQVYVGWMPWI